MDRVSPAAGEPAQLNAGLEAKGPQTGGEALVGGRLVAVLNAADRGRGDPGADRELALGDASAEAGVSQNSTEYGRDVTGHSGYVNSQRRRSGRCNATLYGCPFSTTEVSSWSQSLAAVSSICLAHSPTRSSATDSETPASSA